MFIKDDIFSIINMDSEFVLRLEDLKKIYNSSKKVPITTTLPSLSDPLFIPANFEELLSQHNLNIKGEKHYTFEPMLDYLKTEKEIYDSHVNITHSGFQIRLGVLQTKDIKFIFQKRYKVGQPIINLLNNPYKIMDDMGKLDIYKNKINFNCPLIKLLLLGPFNTKAVYYMDFPLLDRLVILSNYKLKPQRTINIEKYKQIIRRIDSVIIKTHENYTKFTKAVTSNLTNPFATNAPVNQFDAIAKEDKVNPVKILINDLFSFYISSQCRYLSFGVLGTQLKFSLAPPFSSLNTNITAPEFAEYAFQIFAIMEELGVLDMFLLYLDEQNLYLISNN
jgi:hypothetical protein